jgi:23S rRNA (cytidine2498-2'-O)-methyltransferase
MRGHKKGGARHGGGGRPSSPARLPLPPRIHAPPVPSHPLAPREGRMLWTCRHGFEPSLFEELFWSGAMPSMLGQALVEADPKPGPGPAFGRFGFQVLMLPRVPPSAELVASRLRDAARGRPLCVQAWALDTPRAQPLSPTAEALGIAVASLVGHTVEPWAARERGGVLGQICFIDPGMIAVGVVAASEAVSLAPGGRQRMHRGADAPSRAALKLDEALSTLGVGPDRGELCVDLGAAPGGWTQRLVALGARVIAVDPATLAAPLRNHAKVRHVRDSAFRFAPGEPVDWLFCDMAWRPFEVAQLLAKWGRHGWAAHVVANVKLPMKDKNGVLYRVRHVLEHDGRWKHVSIRQLYHDRDEVTLTARRA